MCFNKELGIIIGSNKIFIRFWFNLGDKPAYLPLHLLTALQYSYESLKGTFYHAGEYYACKSDSRIFIQGYAN